MDLSELMQELADALGIQVYEDICTENLDKYITFIYQDERPALVADNEVLADRCDLYINLYVPPQFDYYDVKKQIRDFLEEKEFVINSINSSLDDSSVDVVSTEPKRIRRISYDVSYAAFR